MTSCSKCEEPILVQNWHNGVCLCDRCVEMQRLSEVSEETPVPETHLQMLLRIRFE